MSSIVKAIEKRPADPPPTEEQLDIISTAVNSNDNIMIRSLAGTGKTSTIEMVERQIKTKPILYLVFNKKNAEEAKDRLLSTTTCKTLNSLGHNIWARAVGKKLTLNTKKTQDILRGIIDETPRKLQQPLWDCYWPVIDGVNRAKTAGYVPDGKFPNAKRLIEADAFHASLDEIPDDLTCDLIDAVLTRSIQAAYAGSINYDDQIYMPGLFGGAYPRFPVVAVDEFQDLNAVNYEMLKKLVKGRFLGVGDPWQSIYGFRGAKPGIMAEAEAKFSCTVKNLSVSFRCPRAIVEHVHWRVPHFKWIKDGGYVRLLNELDINDIADNCTFICRNNAPLFSVAIRFLAAGRSVTVHGSELGPKVVGIMRKLGNGDEKRGEVLGLIEQWKQSKIEKGSKIAIDIAECMAVFASHGEDLDQAIRYAEHLFNQKGSIQLMTGHKSKGLEFDNVYFLNSYLCTDEEQDLNLKYVIQTRSKDRLYEIDSIDIR